MGDTEFLDLKIARTGREYRSVPRQQLLRWVAERRVSADDFVRPVGSERWMKVSLAPEMATDSPSPNPVVTRPAVPFPVTLVTPQPAALPAGVVLPVASPLEGGSAWENSLGITAPAKSKLRRRKPPIEDSTLDMTPMIDVTFQLLIFFMLTNTMAHPTPIKVPVAEYGRGVSPDGMQTIVINERGEYFLGDSTRDEARSPTLEALVAEVGQNAAKVDKPLDVIIAAHQDTRHISVRELMERLATLGNIGVVRLGVEEKR